jgi:transcriptional regulator with XRE-family HTH domain
MSIHFKNNLSTLRKLHGKRQHEMSEVLGVPRSTYSGWENNVGSNPDYENLVKISKYFRVSIDVLLIKDYRQHLLKTLKRKRI